MFVSHLIGMHTVSIGRYDNNYKYVRTYLQRKETIRNRQIFILLLCAVGLFVVYIINSNVRGGPTRSHGAVLTLVGLTLRFGFYVKISPPVGDHVSVEWARKDSFMRFKAAQCNSLAFYGNVKNAPLM